jgi:hypothetical protein
MSNYSVAWDEEIPARTKARSLGYAQLFMARTNE